MSGYHHKLITLAEKIVDKVVNFEVDKERFSIIKVSLYPHFMLAYSPELFEFER